LATGLAYSEAFLRHDTGAWHPERPERLVAIVDTLRTTGTWDRLDVWEPAPVDDATLELVHTQRHVASIRNLIERGGGHIDPDTAASSASWDPALRAAGAVVEASQKVADGSLANAVCLPRPPGHHARPDRAMGFCLFNNVAIAAEWLVDNGRAQRVAILDYDVHHGNGTQDVFYERGDVLYISLHQYGFPFFPGTGHWSETGGGAGVGANVNVTLTPGSGDDVHMAVLQRIVDPVVRRFRPEFILVSLGFDAFFADPLASLRLSIGGAYTPLLRSARDLSAELCDGRLVVALEGGYHPQALGHGTDAVCRLLLGEEPPPDPLGPAPDQLPLSSADSLLGAIAELHGLL
jgi:acetoin utilization deacetylase AcuC-like enzyme